MLKNLSEVRYIIPKMKFPVTSDDLKAAGYEYDNDSMCRGCGEPIEWWITPKGKKMPMTVKVTATVQHSTPDVREPHWANCSAADQFRSKKP